MRDVTTTTPIDITPAPPRLEVPDLAELAAISERFEHRPASAIVAWAYDRFGDDLVLAASFQDAVMIDIVYRTVPDVEVAFLDTQYHFAETLWYVEQVRELYDLNLRVITPRIDPDNLWQIDTDACCEMRKVEPLSRALEGKAAWLTGLRRDEASTRANAPIVGWDIGRGIVKVNPLAPWSHVDIDSYVGARGQGRVDERAATRRERGPCGDPAGVLRRESRPREGEPHRDLVRQRRRRVREGPRPAGPPAHRARLRLHRLLAVHASRRRGRGGPRRTLGRTRQDRVRPPPLTP